MRIDTDPADMPRAKIPVHWVSRMISVRNFGRWGFPLLALLFAGLADSAAIYRWTDQAGNVNFSDVVPDEYRGVAKRVDSVMPTPSPEEQRSAIERAARDEARAADVPTTAPPANDSPPEGAVPSKISSKHPPNAPTEDTDCDTWRRLYRESLACFAPFRTALGATKAEAFTHCTPVKEPPVRCGRNAQ